MQIDHMALIYLTAALIALLILLTLLFIKLRQQVAETKKLTLKVERMTEDVLSLGGRSDFSVRTRKF